MKRSSLVRLTALSAAGAILLAMGMPADAQVLHDHLQCFKMKELRRYKGVVNLTPEQGPHFPTLHQ